MVKTTLILLTHYFAVVRVQILFFILFLALSAEQRSAKKAAVKKKSEIEALPRFREVFPEAPPRIELGNKGFADLCLTAWLWRR